MPLANRDWVKSLHCIEADSDSGVVELQGLTNFAAYKFQNLGFFVDFTLDFTKISLT